MADPDPELTEAVRELSEEDVEPARRRKLLGRLVHSQARKRGVKDLFKPRAAVHWVAEAVGDVIPHIQVRDLETLKRHFDGLDGEQLAERLVRNASRVTAGIGAA